MAELKETIKENFKELGTPQGIQTYLFGTKKNGQPRAVYDIIKDYSCPKKKKKKHKNKKAAKSDYGFYLDITPKKKKKKNQKHWHI